MRENKLRRLWAEGKAAINGWCAIPSPYLAEIMANEDFDSVTVDVQHGMIHFTEALGMFQAISTTDTTPLARCPWNEPGILMKLLDAGAYGIICPMINTREECEAFVGACHYPPEGFRSLSAVRAGIYGGPDYRQKANETILTIAMIETRKALDNLKEIVSVSGLDAVFIGPNDLAFSMGFEPKPEPDDREVVEAIDSILAEAHKVGIRAGIHVFKGEDVPPRVKQGFDFVSLSNDYRLLSNAAKAELAKARAL
jgi:4-hydroxy-2-oxoheptanedioate aldolase